MTSFFMASFLYQ